MKKTGILNQPISAVIAGLGHMDKLVISDAGLPIPTGVQRIDLALREGVPSFLVTVETILEELHVEQAIVASELHDGNQEMEASLQALLAGVPIETVPHEAFKERTAGARAIIRTGEFSPYANVILVAGVIFG